MTQFNLYFDNSEVFLDMDEIRDNSENREIPYKLKINTSHGQIKYNLILDEVEEDFGYTNIYEFSTVDTTLASTVQFEVNPKDGNVLTIEIKDNDGDTISISNLYISDDYEECVVNPDFDSDLFIS